MIERPDRTQGKRSFGSCRIAPKVGKTGFFCRFEVYRTAIFPIFRERGLSAEGKLSSLRKGCSPFSPLSCVVAMKYETPFLQRKKRGVSGLCHVQSSGGEEENWTFNPDLLLREIAKREFLSAVRAKEQAAKRGFRSLVSYLRPRSRAP